MTRYRWYGVDWPLPIRSIAKRLKSKLFSGEEPNGFVVDRVRDNLIEARYVERLVYTDRVVDPFGNELQFERVEFRQVRWRATPEWPGLEIIDAPRSSQGFISRLSEVTDFSVAISPLTVDVLRWAETLHEYFSAPLIIDSVQLGDLQLGDGIRAHVVIKGDKDVREACAKLTKGRKYSLEKMQLRINPDERCRVVLMNSAAAKIEGTGQELLLDGLRSSLAAAARA